MDPSDMERLEHLRRSQRDALRTVPDWAEAGDFEGEAHADLEASDALQIELMLRVLAHDVTPRIKELLDSFDRRHSAKLWATYIVRRLGETGCLRSFMAEDRKEALSALSDAEMDGFPDGDVEAAFARWFTLTTLADEVAGSAVDPST